MSDDFCRLVSDHLRDEDVKEERTSLVYTIVGALCLFFLVLLAATWPPQAHAAPKAKSFEECMLYADIALVVAANAKNQIPKAATGKTLPDIYRLATDDSKEIARLILIWIYDKTDPSAISPQELVHNFAESCVKNEGDMDQFLVGKGA